MSRSGPVPGGSPRFPGYDVLGQRPTWDATTAGVVLARLGPAPSLRFFSVEEEGLARPLLNHLLAQWSPPYLPVLEDIDSRLAEGVTDGWHYADMPEDGEAWRRSLAALDALARGRVGAGFAAADREAQADCIQHVRDLADGSGTLGELPAERVWSLWTRYSSAAFYSHPYAWNEIGFGGPAYPRGYKALKLGLREPWEEPEVDAEDPVAWSTKVEGAKKRHAERS